MDDKKQCISQQLISANSSHQEDLLGLACVLTEMFDRSWTSPGSPQGTGKGGQGVVCPGREGLSLSGLRAVNIVPPPPSTEAFQWPNNLLLPSGGMSALLTAPF